MSSTTASIERISIQPDWDVSLDSLTTSRDKLRDEISYSDNSVFWVQYKHAKAEASINSKLSFKDYLSSSNSSSYINNTGNDAAKFFFVNSISSDNRCVEIRYKKRGVEPAAFLTRRFIAPEQVFHLHHPEEIKTVSDLELAKRNNWEKLKRQPVYSIDVTDGGLGVSCSANGSLLIWQTSNGMIRRYLNGHISDVNVCKFFPSGLVTLSGGADLRVKIFSAENGTCPVTLVGHKSGVNDLAIVDKGRNVVSVGRDGECKLWDVGQSKCLATVAKFNCAINSCSLGAVNDVPLLRVIELPKSEEVASEREIGTENKLLACACEDGYLRLIGLHSRKQIFETSCNGSALNCCSFINESTIACGTQDSQLFFWDIRNPKTPLEKRIEFRSSFLSIQPFLEANTFVATTADGSCFTGHLSAHKNDAFTWDFTGPDCDPVYRCSFNREHMFTCCRDGLIRKYSLKYITKTLADDAEDVEMAATTSKYV